MQISNIDFIKPFQKMVYTLFIIVSMMLSCKTTKEVTTVTPDDAEEVEKVVFDTMVVDGNSPEFQEEDEEPTPAIYNPSATQFFDLIHTKLAVSFDWEKEQLIGNAELTLTPYFYPQNMLQLDAKSFDIKSIKIKNNNNPLKFDYDRQKLSITLDKSYKKGEELVIVIDYVAKPNEGEIGGSAAITSDKGLYFINADKSDPDKPQQIWTQGETESSSRWFPTIDKPNERCTQELAITVDDKFTTLSNGTMVSSVKIAGGKRTDTWKMTKPHAPYLFMMAIGEYAWVKDQWKDIPLYYVVEPKYKDYAKQIFNHTPEMLEFFSNKLNYPYPWDKFAQVTARDYVSGAMENTTAVLFGEFVQKTDRELIDDDNDAIVAHEMFHHWFGDLVTCESWANLTLNEGFANYAEYLWFENKYGLERADLHRLNEMQGYLASAAQGTHPLIHYGYGNREDMFDAHSYNKGGLVLHMLRSYVGDEAFFAALNHYLKKNEYSAVEVDELRMAFEEVTGEDLNWFFDQWYLTEGHPEIKVTYEYDANKKQLIAYVSQQQYPNFKIPFDMAIYDANGKATFHKVWAKNQFDTIIVNNVNDKPSSVILDGKDDILAVITEDKSIDYHWGQLMFSPNAAQRYSAINELSLMDSVDYNRLTEIGLLDNNYLVQVAALENMSDATKYVSKLKSLAVKGNHTELRALALQKMMETDEDLKPLLIEILDTEKSIPGVANALAILAEVDDSMAVTYAKKFESLDSEMILGGLGAVYSKSKDPMMGNWFMDKINSSTIYNTYQLFGPFVQYLMQLKPAEVKPYTDQLFLVGTDMGKNNFLRFMAVSTLAVMKSQMAGNPDPGAAALMEELDGYVTKAKAQETDPLLLSRYAEF